MRLFEVDENYELVLNKPWIAMIPEFAEIIKRDKGSEGDYRGSKKLRARRELAFVYFMQDFSSPIRDWEPEEKRKEALYYAGMTEKDVDEALEKALEKYSELMLKASRSLRTLKAMYKGLDALDDYFANLDFTATDKKGELKHDPTGFANQMTKMNKVYDELRNFEKRVEEDMKQATGIRGPNSTLGDMEGQKRTWSERDISEGSTHVGGPKSTGNFKDILETIQKQAAKEKIQQQANLKNMRDAFNGKSIAELEEDDEL